MKCPCCNGEYSYIDVNAGKILQAYANKCYQLNQVTDSRAKDLREKHNFRQALEHIMRLDFESDNNTAWKMRRIAQNALEG